MLLSNAKSSCNFFTPNRQLKERKKTFFTLDLILTKKHEILRHLVVESIFTNRQKQPEQQMAAKQNWKHCSDNFNFTFL